VAYYFTQLPICSCSLVHLWSFPCLNARIFEKDEIKYMKLEDYAGMAKTHPLIAALMAVFMFSLAGIPPFAGFFGKYYLFAATIRADYLWLTIIAVISSIISMYYYIGLIVYMYFKDAPEDAPKARDWSCSNYIVPYSSWLDSVWRVPFNTN
jgi:NADH:ubiquinone oxidoreductase subunit 2 (subunit N)